MVTVRLYRRSRHRPRPHVDALRPGLASGRRPPRRSREGRVRILFTSTPGYGHVLPMLPLARAGCSSGHQVRWATGPDACRVVRAAGIDATEAGLTDAEVAPMRAEARRAAAGLAPEDVPTARVPSPLRGRTHRAHARGRAAAGPRLATRPDRARERRARRAAGRHAARRPSTRCTPSAGPIPRGDPGRRGASTSPPSGRGMASRCRAVRGLRHAAPLPRHLPSPPSRRSRWTTSATCGPHGR